MGSNLDNGQRWEECSSPFFPRWEGLREGERKLRIAIGAFNKRRGAKSIRRQSLDELLS